VGEVDERFVWDGSWQFFGNTSAGAGFFQMLSIRHDPRRTKEVHSDFSWSLYVPEKSHADARGNVAFVDGHVEFAPRRVTLDPRMTNPHLDVPFKELTLLTR